MLCLCHYGSVLLRGWFQTDLGRENSASNLKIQARRRPFLTMVTRWSRSTSNFYALIGQNLTGEFMRITYTASWELMRQRVQKSQATVAFLDSFQELNLEWQSLSNYCIWCLFLLYLISWSLAQFTLTVYAASLGTFVESMIWPSIRFDISFSNSLIIH